jgi:uncharacterized protein YuzE
MQGFSEIFKWRRLYYYLSLYNKNSMKNPQLHIYYDKEADYLEIGFGDPTESHYGKIGPDTFLRIDEKTSEIKGYAIFNVQEDDKALRSMDLEIPQSILKSDVSQ